MTYYVLMLIVSKIKYYSMYKLLSTIEENTKIMKTLSDFWLSADDYDSILSQQKDSIIVWINRFRHNVLYIILKGTNETSTVVQVIREDSRTILIWAAKALS